MINKEANDEDFKPGFFANFSDIFNHKDNCDSQS